MHSPPLQLSDRKDTRSLKKVDGSEAAWTHLPRPLLSSDGRRHRFWKPDASLNTSSLQWKPLDFQFAESLLQRGAGTRVAITSPPQPPRAPITNRGELMLTAPRRLDSSDAQEHRLHFLTVKLVWTISC